MNKIFIDCGTNLGQGLKEISSLENINNDWDVYSFEANPITYSLIEKNTAFQYFNVAVSDSYHFSIFNCESQDKNGFIGGGSTLLDLNEWRSERVYGFKQNYIQKLIPVIDLTDFILRIKPENKSIILKLDIEGSEYKVLKKMHDLNLFKFIRKIYVEFHDHVLLNPHETSAAHWVHYFAENNIEFTPWH
jgi:FkbM family methyltransferase